MRSLRTVWAIGSASLIRTRAIGTPIDSTRSTATPAMRPVRFGRDGVGDAFGADVAEVEKDGQRIGAGREVRNRLARLDDERRATAPRTLADAFQFGARRRRRVGRGAGPSAHHTRHRQGQNQGKAPRQSHCFDVLLRSQRFANHPLLDERKWIVDFLHDDQPVGGHLLHRAIGQLDRPDATCTFGCRAPAPSRSGCLGSAGCLGRKSRRPSCPATPSPRFDCGPFSAPAPSRLRNGSRRPSGL